MEYKTHKQVEAYVDQISKDVAEDAALLGLGAQFAAAVVGPIAGGLAGEKLGRWLAQRDKDKERGAKIDQAARTALDPNKSPKQKDAQMKRSMKEAKTYAVGMKISWRTEVSSPESGPTGDLELMTGRVTGTDGKYLTVKGDDGEEHKVSPAWIEEHTQVAQYAAQISKDVVAEDHAGNLPNELEGLANQITAHLKANVTSQLPGRTVSQAAMLGAAVAALKAAAKALRNVDKAADDCEAGTKMAYAMDPGRQRR